MPQFVNFRSGFRETHVFLKRSA